jgi:hypothetical protein
LLRNLTKYEINLQNLTLVLAKPPFWLFDAGIDGNTFGENVMELFMEKGDFDKKTEDGAHLVRKRDQVARPSKQAAPPGFVWTWVVASAYPSMQVFIYT